MGWDSAVVLFPSFLLWPANSPLPCGYKQAFCLFLALQVGFKAFKVSWHFVAMQVLQPQTEAALSPVSIKEL